MRFIENIRGRVSEPAGCKKHKNNRREELRQAANRLGEREHESDRIRLNCHVTHTFQIATVKTYRRESPTQPSLPSAAIHLSEGYCSFRTRRSINFKQCSSSVGEEKGDPGANSKEGRH